MKHNYQSYDFTPFDKTTRFQDWLNQEVTLTVYHGNTDFYRDHGKLEVVGTTTNWDNTPCLALRIGNTLFASSIVCDSHESLALSCKIISLPNLLFIGYDDNGVLHPSPQIKRELP